jgi:SSS family solute:Na+ symporter
VNAIDWSILSAYLLGMIAFSVYLGRGQSSAEDYYVGGRNLPWWAVGISTMATQTSAVSFISIPAFVALKEGGGLTWLQYELAVPLAMIAVMVFLVPFFRRLELVSVYEYLELRFDRKTRLFMSAVFLISRGLGTGVGVYASALVLKICLGLDQHFSDFNAMAITILLIGVVTVIYDTIGGMTAVVYSDVIQMVVLLGGLVLCIFIGASEVGGIANVIDAMPAERWDAIDTGTGLGDDASMPFWAFLIGGFFLYTSYYGVDQSQAQRELSAPTTADTKRSLVLNGLCRFPITLLYIGLGLTVGAVFANSSELQGLVTSPDDLVPQFILHNLPTGVRAILLAALLAAAMSSLDSALNSLSASTMCDFIEPFCGIPKDKLLQVGRITTVVWGAAITGFAFLFVSMGKNDTIIEVINKVGSAFYGPMLAAFVVGVVSRKTNGFGVIVGVLIGVAVNLCLWKYASSGSGFQVHWMWWNVIGFAVTALVALVASPMGRQPSLSTLDKYTLSAETIANEEKPWLRTYAALLVWFVVILVIAFSL